MAPDDIRDRRRSCSRGFCYLSNNEMIYHLLKIIVGAGIRLYYREIRIKHREYLEHDGPKIILANHPNTLMDAWMIGHICPDRIFYMAKATFFNSPLKMWFLRGLGLIPINRSTESKTANVSNQDSFENCYRLLENGKTLVIFPEGTSFNERQLRMLKSGAARIALEVERRNKGKLNLRIIPVGLVYSEPEKFRSSVLVTVGEPIDPAPLVGNFEKDSLKTARQLTESIRESMENLLVGAHSTEFDTLVHEITDILSSDYVKTNEKGVEKNVAIMKRTFESIHQIQQTSPQTLSEISDLVYRIRWQLEKYEIKSDFLDRRYKPRMFARQLFFSTLFLLLGLPFYLFGVIHNFGQYKLVDLLMLRMVKEMEYYAPVAVLMSLLIYPLAWFGFASLADYLFGLTFWMKLAYIAAMPVLGLFAWFFHKYIGHISFKTNFIFLMMTQKEAVESLKADRQKLQELLFG